MGRFSAPVAFFIYNRPELTRQVFSAIKRAKPKQLFIIADGHKDSADELRCAEARRVVAAIDWDVEIKTNFSEINMGCGERIISGLNWVFEQTETAIILEDDCLPSDTFFRFCDELLNYYRHDERVMHISGCNLLGISAPEDASYFFSRYILPPWGWATWKRAWKKFNPQLDTWLRHKKRIFHHISQEHFDKWTDTFEYIRLNRVTWDVPWNVDIWNNNGIGIIPGTNLVKNIGFGEQATFTKNKNSRFSALVNGETTFPLVHPDASLNYDKHIESACVEMLKEITTAM